LIQVFLNLISNAEHAIREVRDTGRIQIRIGRIGGHISVTVQDDGVGVAQEALPKLFDPFYTTKRPGGGTGLGLSICMSIVREHGGSIDVETLPAGGSAFTVYLPTAPPELSSGLLEGAGLSAEPLLAEGDVLKGRSILVLDDEESIRMLLEEGLTAHAMRVDCAASSQEALELVSRHNYDLALCDVNLSGGGSGQSGRETASQIIAASRGRTRPQIILMTGDLVEENGNAGSFHQLQKPFRISDVLIVLRDALSPRPAEKLPR
jgi:two-component system, cell cycle sensor histidine kinase and response regulator CckA